MIDFKVVKESSVEVFEEKVQTLMNNGYGIDKLSACPEGNQYYKTVHLIAFMSMED